MLIIEPYSVDTAVDILAINVPEDDAYPAWSAAVRYSEGEVVTTGSGESLQIWQARHGSVAPIDSGSGLPTLYNEAIDPTASNTVGRDNAGTLLPNATKYQNFGESWWRDATDDRYLSNRFRMFGSNPALITQSANPIEFDIRPQAPWSGIALFNINADVISIDLIEGPETYSATRTLRYPEILSPSFQNEPQAAFVDIPPVDPALYPSAFLRVRLEATAPRWIHVGCVIIGPAIRIGRALYGLEAELMDFSRFTRDTFGNITTIQRGYSDKITYPHVIPAEFIGQARQILVARRATLTAYIGHPDVALTITYGYFIDLDVPIEGHSQTSASIVVESVLYDTPDSGEPLPDRVVFIEPDGAACIESHLGQALDLCLEAGQITASATASILDITLDPLDAVTWELEWLSGSSTIDPEIDTLITDCGQTLPILRWPPTVPVAHEAGIARIKATVTHDDETTTILEPAVLRVGPCQDCSPTIVGHGWYNPDYISDPEDPEYDPEAFAYSLVELTEMLDFEAKEIPPDGMEISGCAGETKYYWRSAGCSPGYVSVNWYVTMEGAAAFIAYMADGGAIPTTDSEHAINGNGSIYLGPWGRDTLIIRVDFSEDCEWAWISVAPECGYPVGGG